MALTLLGDLLPYENQYRQGYIDELRQVTNVFNGGSNNCIRFQDDDAPGTLKKIAYFKDFGNVSRRDITSSADQTPEKIERAERANFKTFFKFNAIEWQDEAFYTADKMEKEAIMYMIGSRLAKAKLQESIKQAINITAAAIESQGNATVLDLTTGTAANFLQTDINRARSKFGAGYNELKLMVIHSSVFFVLSQNQTMNFQYDLGGGITLYGGVPGTMGMPFIVVDNPALQYGDNGEYFKSLLLTDSAVTVGDCGDIRALLTPNGGKENITHTYQAEWAMWNNVKGYELKSSANPSNNPTDSVLTTAANWQKWTVDKTKTAGVLVKSIADLNAVKQIFYVKNVDATA